MSTTYAIVTFGRPNYGPTRRTYPTLTGAIRAARKLGGGSFQGARILRCSTPEQAENADISDELPVVWGL